MTDPATSDSPKKLSPAKRALGILVFVVVVVGCWSFGTWMRGGERDQPLPAGIVPTIVFVVIGVAFLLLGGIVYGIVLLTRGFTFNFSKPIYRRFGAKLWFANLVVGLFF